VACDILLLMSIVGTVSIGIVADILLPDTRIASMATSLLKTSEFMKEYCDIIEHNGAQVMHFKPHQIGCGGLAGLADTYDNKTLPAEQKSFYITFAWGEQALKAAIGLAKILDSNFWGNIKVVAKRSDVKRPIKYVPSRITLINKFIANKYGEYVYSFNLYDIPLDWYEITQNHSNYEDDENQTNETILNKIEELEKDINNLKLKIEKK
jgi:hypothetical protein